MKKISSRLVFGAVLISNLAMAAPQLNVEGFASCLASQEPNYSPKATKSKYHVNAEAMGTLLPYLAFYPGQRYPVFNELNQKKGFELWENRFVAQSERLAFALAGRSMKKLVPAELFQMALDACGDRDVFCAAVTSHNVLRTLGRHAKAIHKDKKTGKITDYNPDWFKNNKAFWLKQIPVIRKTMIPLRTVETSDYFGEWYHFFGIYTYVLALDAANGNTLGAKQIVSLNKLATKVVNGHEEDPAKVQVDQDSVEVSKKYLKKTAAFEFDCSDVSAYVYSSGSTN